LVEAAGENNLAEVYSYQAKALDGSEIKLDRYKGDVLLVVNTASKCGFTPQFEGLQKLHQEFAPRGLKVLGFPCNQFGAQEPGTEVEIGSFCQKNYGVDFQMFEKIEVNGAHAHPLYRFLTEQAPGILGSRNIKWNFTKFLIDKNGKVVKRYAPTVTPADLQKDIENLLTV
jgi:glutathione peroxidase